MIRFLTLLSGGVCLCLCSKWFRSNC